MSSKMRDKKDLTAFLEAEAQQVIRLLAWDRKMRACKGKKGLRSIELNLSRRFVKEQKSQRL